MRILFISNSTAPTGAPKALLSLLSGLIREGHKVGVVMPDRKGPMYAAIRELGASCWASMPYRLTIYPQCIDSRKRRKRMQELRKLHIVRNYVGTIMDEFHPDIVHTNVGPLDLAFDECLKRGIPHVWHLREFQEGMRFYPSRKTFIRKISSKTNHCVSISNAVSNHWGGIGRVIYDGVAASPTGTDQTTRRKREFLFVGRVEKQKDPMTLLRAFNRFRDCHPDWTLNIVGKDTGWYALRCKIYSAICLPRGAVKFSGICDNVPELMSQSAALVVPSRNEGFGLTLVEAMNAGCPVIARDSAGLKEQMDNGRKWTGREIAFRFNNAEDLAARMENLAKSNGLAAMCTAAREAAAHYSVENSVRELTEYYQEILNGR